MQGFMERRVVSIDQPTADPSGDRPLDLTPEVQSWSVQMRKGVAELAVLGLLDDGARSGIDIFNAFADNQAVSIAEGSIYPLLARLERDGRIMGAWEASGRGTRNLKVYQLTPQGRDHAAQMKRFWHHMREELDNVTR